MTWPVTVRLTDGSQQTFDTVDKAPLSRVTELRGPALNGEACVVVDVTKGETAHRWQTQVKRIGSDETLSIPTFAIQRHGRPVCYLYCHPDGTLWLTTQEQLWP